MQISSSSQGLKSAISLQDRSAQRATSEPLESATDSIQAQASFSANSKVVKAKDAMLGQILDIFA